MERVLILISSLMGGGAERVVSELSNSLPDYDIDVQVVLLYDEVIYPLKNNPISLNLKKSESNSNLLYMLFEILIGMIRYRKVIKNYDSNISISMLGKDNLINIFSNIFTNKRVVISIRGDPFADYLSVFGRCMNYIILKCFKWKYERVITNSNEISNMLMDRIGLPPEKVNVIYNPKNISEIRRLSQEKVSDFIFDSKIPTLITVGRLEKEKGHWHLIRVFAHLLKFRNCRLIICGVGSFRDELLSLINEYHIEDFVYLTGWCANPYKYLSKSNIFVLTSLSEAQPNSMIEAMICGCPVVSVDCNYGPREVLDGDKYGMLSSKLDGKFYGASVPLTKSEDDLLQNILKLLDNPELLSEYSNKSIVRSDIFEKDKIVCQYADIIRGSR